MAWARSCFESMACMRCPARSTSSTSTLQSGTWATRGSCLCSPGRTDPDFAARYNAFFSLPSDDFDLESCERVRIHILRRADGRALPGARRGHGTPGAAAGDPSLRLHRPAPGGLRRRCARSAPTADTGRRDPSACASTCAAGTTACRVGPTGSSACCPTGTTCASATRCWTRCASRARPSSCGCTRRCRRGATPCTRIPPGCTSGWTSRRLSTRRSTPWRISNRCPTWRRCSTWSPARPSTTSPPPTC